MDSRRGQEDDWWRQLYDDDAAAPPAAGPAAASLDEHFASALTALSPSPERPAPPAPPPWPRPTRPAPPPGPEACARDDEGERPVTGEPLGAPPAAQPPSADGGVPPARAAEAGAESIDAWSAEPMFGGAPEAPGDGAAPAGSADDVPREVESPPGTGGIPAARAVEAGAESIDAWSAEPMFGGRVAGTAPEAQSTAGVDGAVGSSAGDGAPPDVADPWLAEPTFGGRVADTAAPSSGADEGDGTAWPAEGDPWAAPAGGGTAQAGEAAFVPGDGPTAPPAAEGWGAGPERTVFGEGDVRWAPELPPGWVAAEPAEQAGPAEPAEPAEPAGPAEPAEAEVVGGAPPAYAAEPTAWPEADPDRLDGLVPDTVLDGAQYGRLTVRTVSVRGDAPRHRGRPRGDALLTARFGSGPDALLLVAMASGARGAGDAHRAAQDAVQWIAGAVGRSRARLADDLRAARRTSLKSGLHRLTDRCYGRLRARSADLGLDAGTYTASLRCLLLPADPECRIRLSFGVGDGGLFRLRDGAWQDLDAAPDEPGDAAAPSGPAAATAAPFRFRAGVAQPGDVLVLCSAGLADPLRGEPELAAHLAARWAAGRPPGLAAYLSDARTRVRGYADDRTAVTVWDA